VIRGILRDLLPECGGQPNRWTFYLGELEHWVRIGWERTRGASVPYPDSEDSEPTEDATTPNGST
jgi:hypothetical protein